MTLSAENDGPRRSLFPLGRFFSTVHQGTTSPEQRRQIRTALGVYEPQITHDLKFTAPISKSGGRAAQEKCGDLDLLPEEAAELKLGDIGDIRKGGEAAMKRVLPLLEMAGHRSIYGSELDPRPGVDHNSPFLVVKVSKDVIDGHSGFFNRRLINFLTGYIGQAEAKALLVRRAQSTP